MKQILIIHGGNSFSSYDAYISSLVSLEISYDRLKPQQKWKTWLAEQLPECDVLLPTFPNGFNAQYDEWVLYFEKLIPFFDDDVRIIGHSLGAMFLTKYLAAHRLPKKVRQLILVAGQYGLRANDNLGSFVVSSAKGLEQSADEIHLFYSTDDTIIEYASVNAYLRDLPTATAHTFTDRGHFLEPEFPELLALLQKK